MITQSDSIGKLAEALSAVQGALGTVGKDSNVKITSAKGSFSYKYADLGAIWDTLRTPLMTAGLAVIQAPMIEGDQDVLVTTLAHKSGEWVRSVTRLPVSDARDPKALGSSITYMRRYSLMSLLGIVTDDDDGNTASGQKATYKQRGRPERTTQPPPPEEDDGQFPTGEPDLFHDEKPKLSDEKAKGLHAAIGGKDGLKAIEHQAFASAVIGREIASFKELNTNEALRIHKAAEDVKGGLATWTGEELAYPPDEFRVPEVA